MICPHDPRRVELSSQSAESTKAPVRRISSIVGLLVALIAGGAVGFRMLSGAGWVDSFYMAVITITTVGYLEAVQLDDTGRIFTMVYLLCGLGVFTYTFAQIGEWIVSARVQQLLEMRRMNKRIGKMNDHYIICGLGRMGATIANYLNDRGQSFVIIDHDESRLEAICSEHNWPTLSGDATQDEVLLKAGLERAVSLATVLPTDADNLFVTLSARLLNPRLQIVARANDDPSVQKLERAGADRVISPTSTGGEKIARFMLTPSIEDFFSIADGQGNDLEMADFCIGTASPLIGKSLASANLGEKGVMIMSIKRADGQRLVPPTGASILQSGDTLFAFGTAAAVEALLAENELHKRSDH